MGQLTLLVTQISQLISCTAVVERVALSIIAVLQNDTQAIEGLHQDLNDAGSKVAEATFTTRFAGDV